MKLDKKKKALKFLVLLTYIENEKTYTLLFTKYMNNYIRLYTVMYAQIVKLYTKLTKFKQSLILLNIIFLHLTTVYDYTKFTN